MEIVGATASSSTEASNKIICRVCNKQYASYTCPRCNARYCSLSCYKGHSVRCNESFMRDNVVTEMKNLAVSPESRRKLLEVLKREHEAELRESSLTDEDDAADGETTLSEETLQKIITNGELSVSDLSAEEFKAFQRAVAGGELSHLIKPWEPWWLKPGAQNISLSKHGNKLVKLVIDTQSVGPDVSTEFPSPPLDPLPALNQISRVEPSPTLPVHLVEVLCSYCFVLRLYNGEWQESSLEAALDVLAVSEVLSHASIPSTVSQVVASCLAKICSPAFRHAGAYNLGLALCDDVACILRIGKGGVVCALADLHRLLECGGREAKRKQETRGIQGAYKKVFFMMCWANEADDAVFGTFATLVEAEKQKLIEMRSLETTARSKAKPIIEEV